MNEQIRNLMIEAGKTIPGDKQIDADFCQKFAELIVAECADLVKARLNHIPDNQDDWDGHNYGETAAVYGILDAFQEHFGIDCNSKNSKFGVEE